MIQTFLVLNDTIVLNWRNNMEVKDIIHGFRVIRKVHAEEIRADVYEMVHEKTGAKTLWLKRDDENKTFAIGFKTTPVDDTGVFHILEHSVLNGSAKYPVKEPFVDLLKGSLQTFLNAMTYPDKTVYPVSSRNNKDFINLMRVYLDAVFHPMVLQNPDIFYQEGWHYELNEKEDEPIFKGVVFNEMKGAFSSADGLKSRYIMEGLFPDTCYGRESGGDPDHIPELSYEQFCANHRRYYNPSNSYIILDGDMDIEEILGIIDDEYLSNYGKEGDLITIDKQAPVISEPIRKEYEISPDSDPSGKAHISYAYVTGDFDEYEKTMAFSLISSVLTDNNESPLKKAILENGLGEDVSFGIQDGLLQPFVQIDIINTDLDKEEKIESVIRSELEKIVKEGLDKEELEATLNQKEFKAKERDFGGMPKGLVFALSSFDSWLYGGDPLNSICFNAIFDSLREKLNTTYYEDLLRECILDSKHSVKVLLEPSVKLGAEKAEKEKKKLHEIAEKWTDKDREELVELNRKLQAWQASEDTPEQKATLPALHLEDLKKTPTKYRYQIERYEDNTIITHDDDTDGIVYASIMAGIDDLDEEDLTETAQLLTFLGKLKTENYDVLTLNRKMRSIFGDFTAMYSPLKTYHDRKHLNLVNISWSSLERNRKEAAELINEIIYRTDFNDAKAIRDILKQNIFVLEQSYINAGHALAVQRAAAYSSTVATASEYASGYEAYRKLKKIDDNWDEEADAFLKKLAELSKKIFIRERYTLSVAAEDKDTVIKAILDDAPHGTIGAQGKRSILGHRREGISVPANISFAAKAALLEDEIEKQGVMYVLANILTYDYLWNNIRVKGGAYGCGFRCGTNRSALFYSYRDPDPKNSLKVYHDTPEYLKDFCERTASIENYIVGTTGDYDPLLSVRLAIRAADLEYLMGVTYEDKKKTLEEILNADKDDIMTTVKLFDRMNSTDDVCVIGNLEALNKCSDQLDQIFDLDQK